MNKNDSERLPDLSSNPYGMASSLNIGKLTQEDGRGAKTANLVCQA